MQTNGKHINYTAADLRRYLSGEMTAREMHALERQALEDPFLADALDGMRTSFARQGYAAHQSAVQQLKKEFNEQKPSTRNLWWKAAAILTVVVTGIAVSFFITDNYSARPRVAKNEALPAQALPQADTAHGTGNSVLMESKPEDDRSKKATGRNTPAEKVQERAFGPSKKEASIRGEEVAQPALVTPDSSGATDFEKNAAVADAVEAPPSPAAREQILQRGANLVDFAEININNEADSVFAEGFMPASGWPEFVKYVRSNLKIADTGKRGVEEIIFVVNNNDRPEKIQILRSVSQQHDNELTRIISRGPAWKIVGGSPRNVGLRFRF